MRNTPGSTLRVALATACCLLAFGGKAQVIPYNVLGGASEDSCSCYTLTPQQFYDSGSVWNKHPIDLTQSFEYHFIVFLGCQPNPQGADGIAFVLQPLGSNVPTGGSGGGMGFEGISPSLGITIDTHQNLEDADPPYDHITFQANGDVNHADANNLQGPISTLPSGASIEDCLWHMLEVKWDAPSKTLSTYVDGAFRLSLTQDIVNTLFGGNSLVYWGFTGGTGGADNLQKFCALSTAGNSFSPVQEFCEGVPIVFQDSSASYAPIQAWYWNFGDGDTSMREDPPPQLYPGPGVYTVTENVLGADGCLSDTNKMTVVIGTYPVDSFSVGPACTGQPLPLVNRSSDSVGRFGTWTWSLSNGATFSDSLPSIVLSQPGAYTLKLSAVSAQGCPGNTMDTVLQVNLSPQVAFGGDSGCADVPLVLGGTSSGTAPIRQWYWNLGGVLDSSQTISQVYTQPGSFSAQLWAVSPQGCTSDTATGTVQIQTSQAYAGQDTVVALGYPIQLQASGGVTYTWSPSTGLNNPDIADPIALITQDTRYTVTAASSAGCLSSASILVKVFKGPALYVPSAFTPNGDGINDVLKLTGPGISTLSYFQVFDRWGKEVFRTTSLQATWDGTESGHPLPPGTYVWMARGTDLSGQTLSWKGTVILIR